MRPRIVAFEEHCYEFVDAQLSLAHTNVIFAFNLYLGTSCCIVKKPKGKGLVGAQFKEKNAIFFIKNWHMIMFYFLRLLISYT